MTAAKGQLFIDPLHPAGYALFLRVLHGIWGNVLFPTVTQHVLGLVAGVMVFDIARRLGASDWWSTLPAAAAVLSIDEISGEHLLMTDSLSGFLLVASTWAAVRSATTERSILYLSVAAVLAGAAITVRATGLVLVPLLLLVAFWAPNWRARLRGTAAVGGGLLLVMVPYLVAQHAAVDRWSLSPRRGLVEYARVAPFADCAKFTPPAGTEFLCESTPPSQRPGPDYYTWIGGPARAHYADFIYGNNELKAFADAAIKAQPLDYTSDVLADFSRYFWPIGARHVPDGGTGPWYVSVQTHDQPTSDFVTQTLAGYYDGVDVSYHPRLLGWLGDLQPIFRVGTVLFSAALLLGLVGVVLGRGPRRWILLFMALPMLTLLACVATATFSVRFAPPVIPFAFIAAALAGSGLTASLRKKTDDEPTPDEPDVDMLVGATV